MSVPFHLNRDQRLRYGYTPTSEALDKFQPLGAVRCSLFINTVRHGVPNLWDAVVHFWDAQGREIGLWSTIFKHEEVFAPNYRPWSQSSLDCEMFFDLPVPECVTGATSAPLDPSEADPCFISAAT